LAARNDRSRGRPRLSCAQEQPTDIRSWVSRKCSGRPAAAGVGSQTSWLSGSITGGEPPDERTRRARRLFRLVEVVDRATAAVAARRQEGWP
jgi:hypothetical protein